ncbi:MAG: hypothetical protein ACE37F_14075 [Nannocystaceae bacterium]|nr:hypothetical protein [bacterium]
MMHAALDGDSVTITERATGVVVGKVPPAMEDLDCGELLDLRDPSLTTDEDAQRRWNLAAWHFLTGERLVEEQTSGDD